MSFYDFGTIFMSLLSLVLISALNCDDYLHYLIMSVFEMDIISECT